MTQVKAQLNYLRIAPRKVRLVADLIRGKEVGQAKEILRFVRKRAAHPLLKLLKSALSNAEHNFKMNPDDLYVSEILVNEGPTLKRWRARARGRAAMIRKRTSHIRIILKKKSPEKTNKTTQ